jgi:hypothetical protein
MDNQNRTTPNALTIAVGAFLLVGAFYGFARGIPTTKWPSTTGEVLSSTVQERYERHDGSYDYKASIAYTYTVNGMKYTSWKIQRGLGEQLQDIKLLDALFTSIKYAKGTQISVYFKPENPAESVIKRGPDLVTYIVLIIGMLFIVLGVSGKCLNIQFKKNVP